MSIRTADSMRFPPTIAQSQRQLPQSRRRRESKLAGRKACFGKHWWYLYTLDHAAASFSTPSDARNRGWGRPYEQMGVVFAIASDRTHACTECFDDSLRSSWLSGSCALRSDDTDACHGQGAQATNWEHPQAGSCQTAKDDGGKPGVRFLVRSKRRVRSMPAWLIVGTRQRRRRFCASGWEETKEGAAVWWRSPKDGNWL
jgi:hypothetical protein